MFANLVICDKGDRMPNTKVVLYKEKDGTPPILEWLDNIPKKARLNNDATQSPDFSRGIKELLVLYTMTLHNTSHDDCKVQV